VQKTDFIKEQLKDQLQTAFKEKRATLRKLYHPNLMDKVRTAMKQSKLRK
jgi:hypothetical protein